MTNFQGGVRRRLSREQILLFTPLLLGVILSAAAGGLLLVPGLQQLQRNQQQLADLKEQEARIPLMRRQLSVQLESMEKAQQRERQILQLIAGSGDISTFMAQLGQEASRSGVQLDSYEPVTIAAPAPPSGSPQATSSKTPPATKAPAPSNTPPAQQSPAQANGTQPTMPAVDPLLAPSLQKTSLLITARGSGPQLQDFLRRIERLSLLVVQSDLSLKVEPPPKTSPSSPAKPGGITTLKLNLSLYSKAPVSTQPKQASPQPGTPQAKS